MAEWSQGWIKLYHEIIIDDKMGILSDHLWRRAIECMIAAGAEGRGGYLPETKALARKLATTEAELEADLLLLAAPGIKILEQRPDGWYVVNHLNRQTATDPRNAQRQADWRKRQQDKYDALRNGVTNALHNPPRSIEVKEEKRENTRRKAQPAAADETLLSVGVVVFRKVMTLTPNKEQRALIAAAVTDGDKWRGVLKDWQAHGWNPKNVPGQLEKYAALNGHGHAQPLPRNDAMDDPQIAYLRRLRGEID